MKNSLRVVRLQMNKPDVTFMVPAAIVLLVLAVTAIIAFAMQRGGFDPASPDYADGARWNMGMVWSLPGFLVYFGVQAAATTFPFALALGSTRRAHVLGTAMANLVTSAYVALIMLVLLGVELVTGHWVFGVYALDTHWFGAGDPWTLFTTAFLGTFVCTSIGGLFGAVWVRYGSRGPTVLGLALALALAVLILVYAPQFAQIAAAVTRPVLAAVAIGIALLSVLGTWLAMRSAAVR